MASALIESTTRPSRTGKQPESIGSYEILGELGRGALGVVYHACHIHLDREVALKVLHPQWTNSDEFLVRFREEGRLLALLDHPHIVRVYDAGQADGHYFLAAELLPGETLEHHLQDRPRLEDCLVYARQLARALAYAHSRGVVHRDVKPANVMVSPSRSLTLMDFGVARLMGSPNLSIPGTRIGTPFYMAPEQIDGRPVDHRADLYALGIMLYELIAGRLPFPGPAVLDVCHGHLHLDPPDPGTFCPEWLKAILKRLLAKRAEHRFESAVELLAALDERPGGRGPGLDRERRGTSIALPLPPRRETRPRSAAAQTEAGAPPPACGPAHLELEVEGKLQSHSRTIRGEVIVGSGSPDSSMPPDIDLREDTAVSPRHARIFRGAGGFFVEDLDSRSGTFLNGRLLESGQPRLLQTGDIIRIGETTLLRAAAIAPTKLNG